MFVYLFDKGCRQRLATKFENYCRGKALVRQLSITAKPGIQDFKILIP